MLLKELDIAMMESSVKYKLKTQHVLDIALGTRHRAVEKTEKFSVLIVLHF